MPIYEYACRTCGERFQELKSMSERLTSPECVVCGSHATALAVSVPGRVGVAAGDVAAESCAVGRGPCCGGGACLD